MIARDLWRERGSVDESDDRLAGRTGPLSDEELRAALAYHHDADLAVLGGEDREEAIEAMLDGYRGRS